MAIDIQNSALYEFHKSVITALASVTTETGIKVYDHIPQSQSTFPYIAVRDMSESPWGSKTQYGSTVSFSIETYIQDKSSLSSKSLGNLILNTLQEDFEIDGFTIIYSKLNNYDITEMENSIYFGSLSFEYYIEENSNG